MKNLYDVTRGQAITIFIFGFFSTWIALAYGVDNDEPLMVVLGVLVGFLTIFYTIGWRAKHLSKPEDKAL